ncbi:hypothetical protein BMF94_5576 [Rhodotorula taiwanensis]|uniref:Flavin reductase like domain-containing protein n=1 Tax=Rhodotorula taiwanensis TaxID=741276 RepID=A0A2S5B3A1_9BASI|nr:hypothetical protein BMF94_5576 [Rhodotorula taiwanensis]
MLARVTRQVLDNSRRSLHTHRTLMAPHPPFPEVQASRPDFDASEQYKVTKIPSPDWKVGTGANGCTDLPGVKEGLWDGSKATEPGRFREIDPSQLEQKGGLYKMMISTPRPIGFLSTVNTKGERNLAPFSYFNMVSHDPPCVMAAFTHPSADELKGTCENILDTKEFVANLISEPFVEAANYTSIDAPKGVSEWPLCGLTPVDSKTIKPPRVGESAFSMECVLEHHYHLHNDAGKRTATVVLGRVKRFHVRSDLIDDSLLVDTDKLQPVSRLGGITYGRTTSVYETPRPAFDKVKDSEDVKKLLAKA